MFCRRGMRWRRSGGRVRLTQYTRWAFSEGANSLNTASHCDIAWAGALATYAHTEQPKGIGTALLMDDGSIHHSDGHITPPPKPSEEEVARHMREMMLCDDPRIWKRVW